LKGAEGARGAGGARGTGGARGGRGAGKAEKTSDRAFPVDLVEKSEGNEITAEGRKYQIDTSYYLQHQIIPVAHRVLQLFGYELSSFENRGQKTLGQWF